MPIDPAIPLSGQPVNVDLGRILQQSANLKNLGLQNQNQQLEIQQRQGELSTQQQQQRAQAAISAAISNGLDAHGNPDYDKILPILANGPAASLIPQLLEQKSKNEKAASDALTAKQALEEKENVLVSQLGLHVKQVLDAGGPDAPANASGLLLAYMASYTKKGLIDPQHAEAITGSIHPENGPDGIKSTIAAMISPADARAGQFNLPAGETRYNADGTPLVSAPAKQEPFTLTPGATRYGPDGQPVASVPPQTEFQSKDVLLDGKPSTVNFNPKTGKYQDASGADVSARVKPIPSAAATGNGTASSDAKSVADAIIAGDQPPDVTGLYRMAGPVRAELARQGYDLTKANLDWQATKKHIATLNGAQQTRLRQSIATASDSLGVIEDLAKKWDGGKFPALNTATLALAKNGGLGPDAQQIATNLEAQIGDVASEIGNVYMGGNSPTDTALGMAAKNLQANWTRDQLLSAVKLARTNLKIRSNSMDSIGAAGLSSDKASTSDTTTSAAPAEGQTKPIPGFPGTEQTFKNGKWIRTK